jgi:hypothetical protein
LGGGGAGGWIKGLIRGKGSRLGEPSGRLGYVSISVVLVFFPCNKVGWGKRPDERERE